MFTIKHILLLVTAIAITLMFMGCSSIRLRTTMLSDDDGWRQYGGTVERTNFAHSELPPPLSVAWMVDASAGFGEYSVVVADSAVFIGNLQGEMIALHVRTGEHRGSFDFGSPIFGAPVVDGSMLYVAMANTEKSVFAYDCSSGSVLWKAALGGVETSPLLVGDKLYVTTLKGECYCIDKHTGDVAWKFLAPLFERTSFLHSSPASDGRVIIFGCDDGSVFCVKAENGKLEWRSRAKKSITGSPSIRNGKVFVGSHDEYFYSFDVTTGVVLWKQYLGASIYSSQAVDDEHVYAGTSGGEIVCMTTDSGRIVWKFKAQSAISCAPLLSGKILYIGSLDKNLYALDARTGELRWKYEAEARIKSMPVVWKNYLILPLDNRMVLGLKSEGKK